MMIKYICQYLCIACGLCLISSCQSIQTNAENSSKFQSEKPLIAHQSTSKLNNGGRVVLFEHISGWNHTSYYPEEYKRLRLLSSAYQINATELALNNQKHLDISTVLVRKLANWDHQHSNGIKINLASNNITFGNFEAINFDLMINANRSVVPIVEQAINYYLAEIKSNVINEKWLEELLVEPAKITFTFVGENYQNPVLKTPVAVYSYSVSDIDEAVNLTIVQTDLIFKWQHDHQETPTTLSAVSSESVAGIVITLDTGNNKTLRSYINQTGNTEFPQSIEEFFIELDITIRDPKITNGLNKR